MKLLSTATLAATLLSYVAADGTISKAEVHQRALKVLSSRKMFHTFNRDLAELSAECLTNQDELEGTGINADTEGLDELSEDDALELCDMEISGESISMDCDFGDMVSELMDSAACASAGGSVIKLTTEVDCDMLVSTMRNMPYCLHTTCDAGDYADMMEDNMDMVEDMQGGDDALSMNCEYSFTVSGAAIGSTSSIISIALVSLFAMLW